MLGTYTSATGGNMTENGRDITDGHAAPIQTSNTYVGLAQKSFVFASAADADLWIFLQELPVCKVFNNDGEQIATMECDYENDGNIAIVRALFSTRVNTAGAVGMQNTYYFRFIDITGDIPPEGISIYH